MLLRTVFAVLVTCLAWHGLPARGSTAKMAVPRDQGWICLFDGETLSGWKCSENQVPTGTPHGGTFSVQDGMIVARGPRSHLFYVGSVEDANFVDFEFRADVMTKPGSNSGIYFHTQYQQAGWPAEGYEVQVNNTHSDWRKTASLYGVKDVRNSPAKDDEWFTLGIIVDGRHVTIKVNNKVVNEYTEPEQVVRSGTDQALASGAVSPAILGRGAPGTGAGAKLDRVSRSKPSGTFALQGHDPDSTVYYKNIMVRPLPRPDFPIVDYHVHLKGGLTLEQAIANARQRQVEFGIAENCGLGFRVTDDQGLQRFLGVLEGQPVYKGMQAEGREWLELFSKDMIARFDYVFTDAMTFTDKQGKRIRLWIQDEVQIDNKEDFMDMYVDQIVSILNSEPIDIYANPTFLPASIAAQYDALWTQERMDKVISAAVKNDVAIEINAQFLIPSPAFIKRAKKTGAKFSFGTNNGGSELGHLEYCRRMARQCELTAKDMFTPKPEGAKPIQTRRVSSKDAKMDIGKIKSRTNSTF